MELNAPSPPPLRASRRVLAGIFASGLQFVIAIGLNLVLVRLVLNRSGQATVGLYYILMQIAGYLALVELGVSAALGRFLSQASDNGLRFRQWLDAGFLLLGVLGLAYGGLGFGLSNVLTSFFRLSAEQSAQARVALMLLAGWGAVRFVTSIYGIALTALQDLAAPPLFSAAGNIARVVYSIAAVQLGFGLTGLVLGLVLAETLAALATLLRYCRLQPGWPVRLRRPASGMWRELLQFGLRAFWVGLAGRVISFTDNIIVGNLYGPTATSIYGNTQQPMTLAYYQVFQLSSNAAPEINRLWQAQDWPRLRDIFLRIQRLTLLLALPVGLGGGLYLSAVIELWVGPAQFGGPWQALWMALFAVLTSLRYSAQVFIFASGDIAAFSRWITVEAAANIALSFALGAWLGPHGVALASLVAQIPTTLFLYRQVQRRLDLKARQWLEAVALRAGLAGLPLAAAAACLALVWPPHTWLALLAQAAVLGSLYAVAVYTLGFSPADQAMVRALVGAKSK